MKPSDVNVSDYDNFVAFCLEELQRTPEDEALKYFENRFNNKRRDNQTGHLRQAFYSAKEFFTRHPRARMQISELVNENGALETDEWRFLDQWKRFVEQHKNIRLPKGGDMGTVFKTLPVSLGGSLEGGGGASPSFKVTIPLVARYLDLFRKRKSSLTPIGADEWDDLEVEKTPAKRVRFVTNRIVRDSNKSFQLKELYEHRCQICERRIEIRYGGFYSEAHHIQPLGGRHKGPDSKPNMLVLCPWHHVEFDYFLFHIDVRTFKIEHRLRKLSGEERQISLKAGHALGSYFIDYNNSYFDKLSKS